MFCSFVVLGKNPKKQKLSFFRKEGIRLAMIEDAPGILKMGIFNSIHLLISVSPGSEIVGVPASDINAMLFPFLILLIIEGIFLILLCF